MNNHSTGSRHSWNQAGLTLGAECAAKGHLQVEALILQYLGSVHSFVPSQGHQAV